MFRDIISREQGEPWGPTGMSTAKWAHIPVETVPIGDLVATQPGVLLHALRDGTQPYAGDQHPHVIHWQDTLYLEDGHHRAVRAALRGETTILARVLRLKE